MTRSIRIAAHPTAGRSGPSRAGLAVLALAIAALAGSATRAAAPGVGLDAGVQASWTRLPLRQWADRAATIAGMPVIVDRRLDPDVLVTLDCRGEPLGAVLERVAALAGARAEPLASSIRIVPAARAGFARAGEAARDKALARLPARRREQLAERAAWSWTEAARPRDLVADAAARAGLVVGGLDSIPHDHFPAASLPPLSLAERLDLVLAHVDLRVEWTATGGTIVPLASPADDVPATAARRPSPRDPPRRGTKTVTVRDVYSLRVEAPLDQALDAIATRLGIAGVDLDRDALAARGIAPGEIVRVDVHEVSRDQLLDAIVNPLGLAWKVTGDRLTVTAAPGGAGGEEKPR